MMREESEIAIIKSGQAYDKRNLFIVKGKVYDLTDWINIHPGGHYWFLRSGGRDISVAVYAYHQEPKKLEKILARYEVDLCPKEVADALTSAPGYLRGNLGVAKATLTYDWDNPDGFLKTLQSRINTPTMQKKIKRANVLFDVVAAIILIAHILMMFVGVPYEVLPLWGFVLFFTVTRTALAAVGHYHCHRKKDGWTDWGDALFDMQYVGATIILYDGHVMGHHFYTNSQADIKRTVFTGMLELPRLFRVPVMTIQKFGQFLTGYFIRWHQANQETQRGYMPVKQYQLLFVRLLLLAEFIFCMVSGYWLLWVLQFITSTWVNLFLIVSSHDFEEPETKANLAHGQDWGVFQVEGSFDMSVVGNGYIDCFLTAGLGTHRTHHVLPNLESGFANMVCNKVVKATWKEFGREWVRTRNFVFERFPKLFVHYMFAPPIPPRPPGPPGLPAAQRPLMGLPKPPPLEKLPTGFFPENFSLVAMKRMAHFINVGFRGIGSI